jgi:hypothetical protein
VLRYRRLTLSVKRAVVSTVLVAGLAVTACASSDSASGDLQSAAAQQTIDAAKEAGFDLDEGCVNAIADQLSDDDAQAIVDAGPDGDPDVSPEGSALAGQLGGCLGQAALLEEFISGMKADGQEFDEACVRDNLEDFDLASIATQGENAAPTSELFAALVDCFPS